MITTIIIGIIIGIFTFHSTSNLMQDGEVLRPLWRWAANVVHPGFSQSGQDVPTIEGAAMWRYWVWKVVTCGKCQAFYVAGVGALIEFAALAGVASTFVLVARTLVALFIYATVGSFTAWALEKKYA